jgi:hypothetical protein
VAQRVLAIVAAVAFVFVAIAIRSALDDDSNEPDGGDGDGDVVLVCATDLAEACHALDGVRVIDQDAAATAADIAEQAAALDGVDGWVTSTAWVEVVDSRAPGRLGASSLIATSPVIVAADTSRAAAVGALCDAEALWACLGDNAGTEWGELGSGGQPTWGTLRTGLPSGNAAIGLSVLSSAAGGFFGGTDFASNDFDSTGFRGWLDTLVEPSGAGERNPVGTLVTTRGKYTAVGDVAAAVGSRSVEVLEPQPAVDAAIVLVALPGGDRLPGAGAIRDALVAAGWAAGSGDPPRPLLKPGVMAALHTLWTEVSR